MFFRCAYGRVDIFVVNSTGGDTVVEVTLLCPVDYSMFSMFSLSVNFEFHASRVYQIYISKILEDFLLQPYCY